jgi:hypothetical protein
MPISLPGPRPGYAPEERNGMTEAGHPADEEPFLEPRDTRKLADERN